jgi:hypothetical protein
MINRGIFMRRLGFLLAASMPALATAQQAPAPAAAPTAQSEEGNSDEPDIIVTGQRNLPGAVIGDIPPDQQLGPADIRSYGVSTVADLLAELSPQTTSGRGSGGAPVVLLNGRRISSFSEIRDIPTEAIQRVDILPEEVALKYGYRADQKVVNFVLRRRFRAVTVEANDRLATEGGRNTPQGTIDLLGISRDKRMNLHLDHTQSSALTESERDITPVATTAVGADGTVIDPTPYRTLLGQSRTTSANAVYAQTIFGTVGATLNGRLESTDSKSLNGLPTAALTLADGTRVTRALDDAAFSPLAQRSSSIAAHLGTTINGGLGTWRWSVTGNYDRSDTQTFTETGVDASAFQARLTANDPTASLSRITASDIAAAPGNRAYAKQSTGGVDALFNGTLFSLPAGAVSTSVKVGAETADFSSRSYRAGLTSTGEVSRDTVNGRARLSRQSVRQLQPGGGSSLRLRHADHARLWGELVADRGYPRDRVGHRYRPGAVRAAARQPVDHAAERAHLRLYPGHDRDRHGDQRGQPEPDRRQQPREETGSHAEALDQARHQPDRQLRQLAYRRSDRVVPDADRGDRGGVPRSLHARCERCAAPGRSATDQFRAQRTLRTALGHQLLRADQVEDPEADGGVSRGHRTQSVRGPGAAGWLPSACGRRGRWWTAR